MAVGRNAGSLAFSFIWKILLIASAAAFEVDIKPPGDKLVKPLTSNALFSCQVKNAGHSDVKIEWFDKDSRLIPEDPSSRIYVEKGSDNSRKLYVRRIEGRDAGKYSCLVTVDGEKIDKSVELLHFKEITFEHVPNPQHPELNCDARIQCQVTGNPTPEVSWRFNGKQIEFGGRYFKETNGLRISKITQADDGNYTCRAEVEADGRYDERTITVIVHIGPSTVNGPGNIEGIEGQEIALSCSSDGLPPPKYEFLKESRLNEWKPLLPSDRIIIDSDFGQVKFRPLAKEDEGAYLCRALNDVGNKTNRGNVRVFVPPKVQEIRNQTVDEGKITTLTCISTGDPPPVMSFQKIGNADTYKNGSNEGGHIFLELKGNGHYEMQIKSVSPSDVGSYICRAHNAVGQHKGTGSISVRYKPRFPKDKSSIVYSWAGRLHNITCSPEGEPTPYIFWNRMDTILPNNDTFRIFNAPGTSSLQIRVKEADQSWIYGEYNCFANNSLGYANFKFALSRASVPDAPQSVTVKEIHPNLVQLAIEPPKETGGVRLVGYRVEFNNKVHDFSIVDPSDRTKNKSHSVVDFMKIENLKPATSYTFRIRAKNEVGVGNKIEKVITTTNFSRPAPIHLISPTRGLDSSTYKIMWKKPGTGGKPIKEYEIRYKKVKISPDGKEQSEEDWKIEKRFDSSHRPMLDFVLTGLSPNTQYKLEVLARNDVGSSKPEKAFYFRTSAQPQLGQSSQAAAVYGNFLWLPAIAIIKILMIQWTGPA